jgi:malonyl-CoA O-methyltransferase
VPSRNRIRQAFNRIAPSYDATAPLAREVNRRLLEHLEFLKVDPKTLLDLGAATGYAGNLLRERFPQALLLALDPALQLLRANPWRPRPWWRPGPKDLRLQICGYAEHLPIRSGSIGLVWSNLALPWFSLEASLKEVLRVLEADGLFLFSSFGPDTLKELRQCFPHGEGSRRTASFMDMHDVGDALVQAGFASPVMDQETITMTYAELGDLFEDLRAMGGKSMLSDPVRSLTGKDVWRLMTQRYESLRQEGRMPATFEIVYGHAWKPAARKTADGRPIIEVRPA